MIGLAAPYRLGRVWPAFIDIVPVFGDKAVTLEYGVSAYCNTVSPRPSHEECIRARRNTWWRFEVEAFNGEDKVKISGDLNLDRHLKVTLTSDSMRGEVIRPEGAET